MVENDKTNSTWIYHKMTDNDINTPTKTIIKNETESLSFKEQKEKQKEKVIIILCLIFLIGTGVIGNVYSHIEYERTYRQAQEHFTAGNYEEVIRIVSKYNMENYKDVPNFYALSVEAVEAQKQEEYRQEVEETYQNLLKAHSDMKETKFTVLESIINKATRLELEDYKNSKKLISEILDYFTFAEKIWNEYSNIAYAHTLDMTTREVQLYAQKILGERYQLSAAEVQRIYNWWHDYVAKSGRYVHYS